MGQGVNEDPDILGLCRTTLKGTFALDQAVARGGFGIVYRGRHLSLQKEIAVKVFCPLNVPRGHRRAGGDLALPAGDQDPLSARAPRDRASLRLRNDQAPTARRRAVGRAEWLEAPP